MANRTDRDRTADQVAQLLRLKEPSYSVEILRGLAERHTRTAGRSDGALVRDAIELVEPPGRKGERIPVVRGELMVEARDPSAQQRLRRLCDDHGLSPVDGSYEGLVRLQPAKGRTPHVPAARLACGRSGLKASVNHVVSLGIRMKGQASPEYTDNEPGVLDRSGGRYPVREEVPVVVIDTGLSEDATSRKDGWLDEVHYDRRHLDPLRIDGGPEDPLDVGAGHGTFVAGVIRQVDPSTPVIMLRALDTDGVSSECTIGEAIDKAVTIFQQYGDRGVLNLSFGVETVDDNPPLAIEAALGRLPDSVMVVAAAGNFGTATKVWPAASDRVLAVAALDRGLQPTEWSNHGPWVDFSTVGEGVVSTFVHGTEDRGSGFPDDPRDPDPETFPRQDGEFVQEESYALWTGTSFAAPRVAAWLATYLDRHPDAGPAEAEQALRALGCEVTNFGCAVDIPKYVV